MPENTELRAEDYDTSQHCPKGEKDKFGCMSGN